MSFRFLQFLVGLLVLMLIAQPARANDAAVEAKLRSAFLYNFAQFVEWPTAKLADDGPIVIGVWGDAMVADAMRGICETKKVGKHSLTLKQVGSVDEAVGCHMVYVDETLAKALSAGQKQLNAAHVLTVSNSDTFLKDGGIIRFFVEEGKIRFEVRQSAAEIAGVKISSRLLKLARLFVE
jgi:hypothetical protein